MNSLPLPIQFIRQVAQPLDADSVFTLTTDRNAYLTNARRYPGQIVADTQAGDIFMLNAAGNAWISIVAGSITGNNGITVSSQNVTLGQTISAGGDPGKLTGSTEVPLNTNFFQFRGSTGSLIKFNDNGSINGRIILNAGTITAGTAPAKFTSGPLLTTAEVGAVEFLTDKGYLTITTGAARKEITLNDAALSSGSIVFATTNGRVLTSSNLTWDNTNTQFVILNSVTGSSSQSALGILPTWNTTGTPIAVSIAITDTASNAASLIFKATVGGTSKIAIDKTGNIVAAGSLTTVQPSAHGNAAWNLGTIQTAASTLDATRYVEVSIGGTVVKLAVIS